MMHCYKLGVLILTAGVAALGAQSPQRTFVNKTMDASTAAGVRLLGESVDADGNIKQRQSGSVARQCSNSEVAGTFQTLTIHNTALTATLSAPAAWQVKAFRSVGEASADAAQTVLRLRVPMKAPNHSADAVIIVGPDEGYPDVILPKGSRALAEDECYANLSTGQSAAFLHATALMPDGGIIHYSLGYAALTKGRWLSFLATADNAEDVPTMGRVFRSLAITAVR